MAEITAYKIAHIYITYTYVYTYIFYMYTYTVSFTDVYMDVMTLRCNYITVVFSFQQSQLHYWRVYRNQLNEKQANTERDRSTGNGRQ